MHFSTKQLDLIIKSISQKQNLLFEPVINLFSSQTLAVQNPVLNNSVLT